MSLQTALVALVAANEALSALIGDRFRPDELHQGDALPACRFQVISRRGYETFGCRTQFTSARVQVDGWADTSVKRTALRTALLNCFTPAAGLVRGEYGGETIQSISKNGEREGKDLANTNAAAYRISIDFLVHIEGA